MRARPAAARPGLVVVGPERVTATEIPHSTSPAAPTAVCLSFSRASSGATSRPLRCAGLSRLIVPLAELPPYATSPTEVLHKCPTTQARAQTQPQPAHPGRPLGRS